MEGDRDEGEERLVVCFCLFVVNARFSSLSKVKGLKAFFFLIDDKCNVFFSFICRGGCRWCCRSRRATKSENSITRGYRWEVLSPSFKISTIIIIIIIHVCRTHNTLHKVIKKGRGNEKRKVQ